jgi:hypothetical protein|tara:strand:+ start:1572 stop:2255 length:684 start_codon:yes stop_codon:yes gene_type:complete
MKIGIHQPQFLPWLPYFLKIEACDYFVFLDIVDYQKNGLQNRNQIKSINGKQWLTIPIKNKLGQKINDVKIFNSSNWKKKHLSTIDQQYSKSKFFEKYFKELKDIYNYEWDLLSNLNISIIKTIMRWLDIQTPLVLASELEVSGKSNELILNICKTLKAKEYISGIGAKTYIDEELFKKNNIILNFKETQVIKEYEQLHSDQGFINDLSVIDIVFNCGETWRNYIDK